MSASRRDDELPTPTTGEEFSDTIYDAVYSPWESSAAEEPAEDDTLDSK